MTEVINVMFALQSCSDSLHILPSSPSGTYAASSDCAYHIGNTKAEEEVDMQVEEVELNVKTEKGIASEEECIDIKDEESIYSEEEEEEEEEYIDIKKEEDVGIKEEVSFQGTV